MAGSAADKLASIFGGMAGKAVQANKTRKQVLEKEEEKSMAQPEPEGDDTGGDIAPAPRPSGDRYPWH